MRKPVKPHTKFVKVEIGEKKKRSFNVPKGKVEGILKLIEEFEDDSVPWREAFAVRFPKNIGQFNLSGYNPNEEYNHGKVQQLHRRV